MLTTKPPLDVLKDLDPARIDTARLTEVPPMPLTIFADAIDTSPHPHRTQRRALVAGAVTVVVAAAVAIPTFTGSGPSTASAAQVLQNVAVVADRRGDALPRDDQFFYVKSTVTGYITSAETNSPTTPTPVSSTREAWASATRPGRLLTTPTAGGGLLPTPNNGKVGSLSATRGLQIGSERLSRTEIASFPTDPREVYRRLVDGIQGRGQSAAQQVFDDIKSALAEQPVPADLRSTLYRTLALVPGIELADDRTDPNGRPGTTVAFEFKGTRAQLTFDPDTAELLASRTTITNPAEAELTLPAGTTLDSFVYNDRSITDTTERP